MTTASHQVSKTLKPSAVTHLAFEGGGAKGIAFIGALAALEAVGVKQPAAGGGGLRGVSGASAGSMTAFLYAMGLNTDEFLKIQLAEKAFTRFFERPQENKIRTVRRNKGILSPMVHFVGPKNLPLLVTPDEQMRRFILLNNFPWPVESIKVLANGYAVGAIFDMARDAVKSHPDLGPMLRVITASRTDFMKYLYCLFYDFGVFSGAAVTAFLRELLLQYLKKNSGVERGENLSVGEFARKTKLHVAFAATNVSTGRGRYFRASPTLGPPSGTEPFENTPNFPVVDAVAISSAYPLAFKPYAVFDCPDVANGYWMDGGVQTNFPLHAFDAAPDGPLNPGMLGIRLEETAEGLQEYGRDAINYFPTYATNLLLSFVGDLLNTGMYSSEGGQIRTAQEQAQTVEVKIPASVLSTLNFAPSRADATAAILLAFDAVAEYFVPGFQPGFTASDPQPIGDERKLKWAREALRSKLV